MRCPSTLLIRLITASGRSESTPSHHLPAPSPARPASSMPVIRDWLHVRSPLDSFFDVHDLPPGLSFAEVLLHKIGACAVMAVHTDS